MYIEEQPVPVVEGFGASDSLSGVIPAGTRLMILEGSPIAFEEGGTTYLNWEAASPLEITLDEDVATDYGPEGTGYLRIVSAKRGFTVARAHIDATSSAYQVVKDANVGDRRLLINGTPITIGPAQVVMYSTVPAGASVPSLTPPAPVTPPPVEPPPVTPPPVTPPPTTCPEGQWLAADGTCVPLVTVVPVTPAKPWYKRTGVMAAGAGTVVLAGVVIAMAVSRRRG